MKFKKALLSLFILLINLNVCFAQTASLLPNALQQYFDNNGNPLSSGTVTFYIAGTSTLKNVWRNSSETVLWSNPITLDAGGKPPGSAAGIYGQGTYRQVVKDRNGNTIWDAVTAADGSGASTATGDGDLVGTIKPWSGVSAPNQYVFAYGQEISRSTYSVLYTAITLSTSAICTNTSNTLTGISNTEQIPIGSPVEILCVSPGTTVVSKTSSTVVLSNPASISITTTAVFFPFGNGNATTTFNVPDLRGNVLAGRPNMGGTASTNLTSTYCVTASQGGTCGSQSHAISIAELAAHTHTSPALTDPGHAHTFSVPHGTSADNSSSVSFLHGATVNGVAVSGSTATATTGITLAASTGSNGSGTAFSVVQPTMLINYIIKITPDTNSAIATGVTDIQGMTGSISCDTGLTCTGNIISLSSSATAPPGTVIGNTGLTPVIPFATATPFLGTSGSTVGSIAFANLTSGSITLQPTTGALGTVVLSLPAATDTIVGKATTDTLTHKTFDTAGTGNVLKVAGTQVTALSGNTATLGSTSGTLTNGDCVKIDASGNLVDNGATCGAGSNTAHTDIYCATGSSGCPGTYQGTFTAGTTTSLTLAANPGSATLMDVYFDGISQTDTDVWSVSTTTLTFVAAIPTNVQRVRVHYYSPSTTGGVGSITDVAGNVASGAVTIAGPWTISANKINSGGACVVQSRTIAITLNLSTCNAVQTMGFAIVGDGGQALFKNVSATAFTDVSIATGSITNAGSTYTNGTYTNIALTGGTGIGAVASSIVVSGNVVTAVTLATTPNISQGYAVGDILSATAADIGGTGTGFAWTVATSNSAVASFTDISGAHFQYLVGPGNTINIKQFGAKVDWNGVDGSATDDHTATQAALAFASIQATGTTSDAGGFAGSTVLLPKGTSLICGNTDTIIIPASTTLIGLGHNSSTFKVCNSGWNSATNIFSLCDYRTHKTCFSTKLKDITIYENSTPASSSNSSIIYTNNDQQFRAIEHVGIYSGLRRCLTAEIGYGGAAYIGFDNLFCTIDPTSVNAGIFFNYGTTVVTLTDSVVESGGSGATTNGISIQGGQFNIKNLHSEGISTIIDVNMSVSTSTAILENITGGAHCTEIVKLENSNTSGNSAMLGFIKNGCTRAVSNGQTAGTSENNSFLYGATSTTGVGGYRVFNP